MQHKTPLCSKTKASLGFVRAWFQSQGGKKREVVSEGMLRTGGWRDVLFRGLFSCWTGWPLNTRPLSGHYHNPLNSTWLCVYVCIKPWLLEEHYNHFHNTPGLVWSASQQDVYIPVFSVALYCSGPLFTSTAETEAYIRDKPLFLIYFLFYQYI